jgi:hypothetical protein
MQMLTAAVNGLNHLDRLVPVVEDHGDCHSDAAGSGRPYRRLCRAHGGR